MIVPKLVCGNVLSELQKCQSETVDLVIADPPYFRVTNNKWDRSWKTLNDYIEWAKTWLSETYRVLRHGGSFYLFGYMRIMAHLVPYLTELGFEYREEITINKGMQVVAGRATKEYKLFPNVTETVILLVKNPRPHIQNLLVNAAKARNLDAKSINAALGVKTNGGGMWSIYTGNNICAQIPTEEMWLKFQKILGISTPYCKISQTFNAQVGLTNVWDDISFRLTDRIHPTQKPAKLIDRLIKASSNENDLIYDLFSGSGIALYRSAILNRRCIGIEVDVDMHEKSTDMLRTKLISS